MTILSIIIVNYNTKDLLQQCLNSLFENWVSRSPASAPPTLRRSASDVWLPLSNSLEIIIIDNNSTDGSRKFLKKLNSKLPSRHPALSKERAGSSGDGKQTTMVAHPAEDAEPSATMSEDQHDNNVAIPDNIEIKTILNKTNLGFAKANNQGIKIARGKYILLLNSDTIAKRGALEKMAGYLEEHGDVAAVSPKLLNPNGSFQQRYYMRFPNLWQILFYHNIGLRWLTAFFPVRKMVFSQADRREPIAVDQLPGAALMARRTVWRKTGGLDEDYFFFFEDVDWSCRVKEMGLGKLMVVPAAEIIHFGGGSWQRWRKEERFSMYRRYFASFFLFLQKHHYPLWAYRLFLSLTLIDNALIQLLRGRLVRARVQGQLLLWLWHVGGRGGGR